MANPSPRPATGADLPELVRVINAAYRVEDFFIHGDRTSTAELEAMLDRPNGGFLVVPAADGDGLVAAAYLEYRGRRLYFGLLSVDPAAQGAGYGRMLVEAIERRARDAGCDRLEIEVVNLRQELPAFYARLGFTVTGTRPFHTEARLKLPAHMVLMEKPLRA